jgi:hypothetical protein
MIIRPRIEETDQKGKVPLCQIFNQRQIVFLGDGNERVERELTTVNLSDLSKARTNKHIIKLNKMFEKENGRTKGGKANQNAHSFRCNQSFQIGDRGRERVSADVDGHGHDFVFAQHFGHVGNVDGRQNCRQRTSKNKQTNKKTKKKSQRNEQKQNKANRNK